MDDDVASWLTRTGAVARHARKRSKVPDEPADTEPDSESEEPDEPADTEDKRPARTASLDTWKAFAEKQGIQTKGMSKQDIIAATA
ncbi:hypothetical protein ACT3TD_02745 [Corynebacterium sp. AOP36-E1-14]